jgi:hypothetical protein
MGHLGADSVSGTLFDPPVDETAGFLEVGSTGLSGKAVRRPTGPTLSPRDSGPEVIRLALASGCLPLGVVNMASDPSKMVKPSPSMT